MSMGKSFMNINYNMCKGKGKVYLLIKSSVSATLALRAAGCRPYG